MNDSTALVPLQDTMQLGKVLAESGFFSDSRSAAQAVVKVLAGRELDFGPVASMTGINIIQGRVSLSANLQAAAVKRSKRYNYRVREMTDEVCEIEFFERMGDKWDSVGKSRFTKADAVKAQTKNMDKFPRNMLFARAMSNGVKWYCPDVTGGPVYTPEELGADVNEDGEIIEGAARVVEQPPTQTPPPTNGNGQNGKTQPHWIDDPTKRAAFWAKVNELGVSENDAHVILHVEHLRDYAGTGKQAIDAIKAEIAAREELFAQQAA